MRVLVTCQYNQKPHLLDDECVNVTYVDLTKEVKVADEAARKAASDERFLMRHQAHGFVSQATLAVAINPAVDVSAPGSTLMRTLRAAHEAGYYRKPTRLAVIFGRRRPAALTAAGHRWMDLGMAGFLRTDKLDEWLAVHKLSRADFRHLVDR